MDKTKLAEEKLASVGKLEEENTNLKAALDMANKEVSRLKNDKIALSDQASELVGKKNDLEAYLEDSPRSYSSCLRVISLTRLTCNHRLIIELLAHL